MDYAELDRDARLMMLGARLHELETRTPGIIDTDKWSRTDAMLWIIIESQASPQLDKEWAEFCLANKMEKYLKLTTPIHPRGEHNQLC